MTHQEPGEKVPYNQDRPSRYFLSRTMPKIQIHALPYQKDPILVFELVSNMPWAQILDSGSYKGSLARFDIITADPYLKITTSENNTIVQTRDGKILDSGANAFDIIRQQICPFHQEMQEIPFCGGLLGYFGYDLQVGGKPSNDKRPAIFELPDMALGTYDWAIISDHHQQQTYFVSAGNDSSITSKIRQQISQAIQQPQPQPAISNPLTIDQLETDTPFEDYQKGFERIREYLVEGDCYQINYARSFIADTQGSAWDSYKQLRKNNPVPFAAYLQFPFAQIISASPERFIHIKGDTVETRPIKGTRPRSNDIHEDQLLRKALQNSEKDKAENLMIVDLLRNDLGKTCQPGSIQVPELFSVENYPTVFHLVSSITGKIADNKTAIDVLQGCFPGGSITGAPKKRAMEIIQELEKNQRGIYCGAIGYISFNGNLDTNIAIRTMTVSGGKLAFWAGGGIVADSNVNDEFKETQDKARAFLQLLAIDEEI